MAIGAVRFYHAVEMVSLPGEGGVSSVYELFTNCCLLRGGVSRVYSYLPNQVER